MRICRRGKKITVQVTMIHAIGEIGGLTMSFS